MTVPITFSGHHVEVTQALRDFATDKFKRLERRGDHITSIAVTLTVEKLRQIAKATIHVKGAEIYASAESSDMYAAIDSLVDKLTRQITKHHEEHTSHHV